MAEIWVECLSQTILENDLNLVRLFLINASNKEIFACVVEYTILGCAYVG